MISPQRIIFTETSLANVLTTLGRLDNTSAQLITDEVFRKLSELTVAQTTPETVWCGHAGLYQSTLAAVANGEQLLAPAIVLGLQDQNDFTAANNAEEILRAAQLGFSKTIQRALPVGSKLRVCIGVTEFNVTVTSHCQAWQRPGEFYAKNVETGKRQIFSHHQVLEVLP